MREILFRGERVDSDEWVYGFLVKMWGQYHIVDQNNENSAYMIEPETVGQYTGLTDKNGKKIFEGDILLKGFEKVLVKWNANQCRWGIYSNNYEICGFNESTQGYFEVIGNVHDNSELLEVEQ